MAAQSNGITVVEVNDGRRTVHFYVGTISIRFVCLPGTNECMEAGRSSLEGRRDRDGLYISGSQYRALIRQAHAIAASHGWKK